MIKSFKDKETEKLFKRLPVRKIAPSLHRPCLRKLLMLNEAAILEDLRVPPANRLEALKGNRKGQYSIRINDQWRICFKWEEGNVYDVEIADYH